MTVRVCPKCDIVKELTKHHYIPKFFKTRNNNDVLLICRACHDVLEKLIRLVEGGKRRTKSCRLEDERYRSIVEFFLSL